MTNIKSITKHAVTCFTGLFFPLCMFTAVTHGQQAKKQSKPNIILVMADDQGWGDTGYNGHSVLKTPHLDSMAKNGLVFDRFYAAAPVCSPTRASVLTGRSPMRTKVVNHGHYLRPQEFTIAKDLKNHGYKTGLFGKFHLGSAQPNSPCNPSSFGFDRWVIGLNFFDLNPYLSRNGKVEQFQGRGSVIAMNEAIAFLKKNKDQQQPLFTVIWFPAPHLPHKEKPDGPTNPKQPTNLYGQNKNRNYFNEISLIDQQMGRLQRELKDLKMDQNTILWYCSDNGGLLRESSGGRAKKGSIYEGGLRVPSIVQWPEGKLKGRVSKPVSTVDLYPTLLAMIGEQASTSHPLDGQDIIGLIKNSKTHRSRPLGFWHHFQKGQATHSDRILREIHQKQSSGEPLPHNKFRIKKDVDQFPQYGEDSSRGHSAWLDWPWKLHRIEGARYELYNLESDPLERNDLSTDPKHQKRLIRMKSELKNWMKSVINSLNGKDYQKKG